MRVTQNAGESVQQRKDLLKKGRTNGRQYGITPIPQNSNSLVKTMILRLIPMTEEALTTCTRGQRSTWPFPGNGRGLGRCSVYDACWSLRRREICRRVTGSPVQRWSCRKWSPSTLLLHPRTSDGRVTILHSLTQYWNEARAIRYQFKCWHWSYKEADKDFLSKQNSALKTNILLSCGRLFAYNSFPFAGSSEGQ